MKTDRDLITLSMAVVVVIVVLIVAMSCTRPAGTPSGKTAGGPGKVVWSNETWQVDRFTDPETETTCYLAHGSGTAIWCYR